MEPVDQPRDRLVAWKKEQGRKYLSRDWRVACKINKAKGLDAAIDFLKNKEVEQVYDFRPPAKCNVVAQSRPFEDWPISRLSAEVQRYFYGLTSAEFDAQKIGTSKKEQDAWFAAVNIIRNNVSVQAVNLIVANAKETYLGVLKKVDNRNVKRAKKHEKRRAKGCQDDPFIEDSAFTETGHLKNPPGINSTILGYQGVTPEPLTHKLAAKLNIPLKWLNCDAVTDAVTETGRWLIKSERSRLKISEGQPGYVPLWQRSLLSKKPHKNRRRYYRGDDTGILPVVFHVGDDWAILDIRGLLRNARWRRLVDSQVTLDTLLNLFSGDPTIDPKRSCVTYLYKEGIVPIQKTDITHYKKSKEMLLELTNVAPVAFVSVDLGQTNLLAVRVSTVRQECDWTNSAVQTLTAQHKGSFVIKAQKHDNLEFVSQELEHEAARYRESHDELESGFRRLALESLTIEQQTEVATVQRCSSEETKTRLCNLLQIAPSDISWDDIASSTTFISDFVIKHRPSNVEQVMFSKKTKKGKIITKKKYDTRLMREHRSKVSKETNDALNLAIWDLQKKSPVYQKRAQRLKEFARRTVNYAIQEAKRITGCDTVVFAIEDLNVDNRMFSGKGKRPQGWDNLFKAKKENRWFIQSLHKAVSELTTHRGTVVIEVPCYWTSCTCVSCGYCDSNNRNGERFVCLNVSCGVACNADLDVATANIEKIALSGVPLAGPASGKVRKKRSRTARKPKDLQSNQDFKAA